MDDSLRELLTEHLPAPPTDLAEAPLAAIRRRARRRTGAQMAAAIAAVAVIATGTVVLLGDDGTASNGSRLADSTTETTETTAATGMLHVTNLPPGYREDVDEGETVRYINPAADPPIPLVVRRLPEDARIPAEGPSLGSPTVRGHAAEVLPIANGGMTLTWLENGSRFSVSFEAPPNTQIDFAIEQTVDVLVAVADGLRLAR